MSTISEKRVDFRQLHQTGCFVLPNPWDIGSARYLEHLGFKALATTSAGFAFSRGLPDYGVSRDEMLAHLREMVEAVDLPVNADFANGYAHEPERVARNVSLALGTGVAGLSVEDSTGEKEKPLYELELAVERIAAARSAMEGTGAMLVARAECFLVGQPDLGEVIRRLTAYSEAGADCLYAPGVSREDEIRQIVQAVSPKPVNVLSGGATGLTIREMEDLGVRRVSVGGALARVAWGGFMAAAKELATRGTFAGFAQAAPHDALNMWLESGTRKRAATTRNTPGT